MTTIRVLNLVTNAKSRFFRQQVRALRSHDVDGSVLPVPGRRWWSNGESGSRTVVDYLRHYQSVLRHSFHDYDLIHANYGLTAPAAVMQPNLPVVLSLWGTDLMGPYGFVSQYCSRACDAVIVMSDHMAGLVDRECHVIPHGVDFELFRPMARSTARRTVGWDDADHHVLFPYPTNRAVKNYPRAERIASEAARELDRAVALETVWREPHRRMPVYMNAADALLLTSNREGSPNAVKEALACNLPVVSTDVGDVAKRLEDVSPSLVARTDRGLVDGLRDVLRQRRRSNGREAIEDLRVENTSRRLRRVYEEVLDWRERVAHSP